VTNVALGINASGGTPSYAALNFRQALSSLFKNGTTRVLGGRSGYTPGRLPATLTITGSGPYTWTISAFAAYIDPAFTTTQAGYACSSDANNTGTLTTPDATNPRIDILYATVNDTDIDSSTLRSFTVNYLAGTAAASPTQPATPVRSFLLAVINVPHTGAGTPTITVNPTYAVAAGGILPTASSAAYPATAVEGDYVDDAALNALLRFDGAAWRNIAQDRATYTPVVTAAAGTPTVGNGTATGWYQLVGRACVFSIDIAWGSTSNGGGGAMSLSLPVAAVAGAPNAEVAGVITLFGGAVYTVVGQIAPSATTLQMFAAVSPTASNVGVVQNANTSFTVGTGVPQVAGFLTFAAGAGPALRVSGSYWVA
jgi:hypothetical protein